MNHKLILLYHHLYIIFATTVYIYFLHLLPLKLNTFFIQLSKQGKQLLLTSGQKENRKHQAILQDFKHLRDLLITLMLMLSIAYHFTDYTLSISFLAFQNGDTVLHKWLSLFCLAKSNELLK